VIPNALAGITADDALTQDAKLIFRHDVGQGDDIRPLNGDAFAQRLPLLDRAAIHVIGVCPGDVVARGELER
jgi:hypothetical protein